MRMVVTTKTFVITGSRAAQDRLQLKPILVNLNSGFLFLCLFGLGQADL